jgi:hypothetical protein
MRGVLRRTTVEHAFVLAFQAGQHDAHLRSGDWIPDCEQCARSLAPLPF